MFMSATNTMVGVRRRCKLDVAGYIVKRLEGRGDVQVGTLIMDEGSTTIARIRAKLQYEIVKHSDIKHLQVSLYKQHAKLRTLTGDAIKYLLDKCLSCALAHIKGHPESLSSSLQEITPHAFGCHDNCGDWCMYLKDPDNYRHKYVPNGKNFVKGATQGPHKER